MDPSDDGGDPVADEEQGSEALHRSDAEDDLEEEEEAAAVAPVAGRGRARPLLQMPGAGAGADAENRASRVGRREGPQFHSAQSFHWPGAAVAPPAVPATPAAH
jgi:hypothetical protein